MARLLFTVWPFPTHLRPHMAVGRELLRRGHSVCFYTGGSGSESLEEEGFELCPFHHVDWESVKETVALLVARRRRPHPGLWRRFLVATVPAQLRDLEPIIHEWKPDAVVCDVALWGPILILHERDRMPVAVLSHLATCLLAGSQGSILGMDLPRFQHWYGRALTKAMSLAADAVRRCVPNAANRLRSLYGLPPITSSVNEYAGTMPLYLIPGLRSLDRNRSDLSSSVHYVGPCLWSEEPASRPDWIDDFKKRDLPGVVVDEGSLYPLDTGFLEKSGQALSGFPCRAILMAGEGRRLETIGMRAGENLEVHPWTAPQHILPEADLVVTNGNTESVLTALTAGVPVVLVPYLWDQTILARRIQQSGAGKRVSPGPRMAERLQRAILQVLNDPGYRSAARELGIKLSAARGPTRASHLLEEMVSEAAGRTRPEPPP